jgi:hypothetical protein
MQNSIALAAVSLCPTDSSLSSLLTSTLPICPESQDLDPLSQDEWCHIDSGKRTGINCNATKRPLEELSEVSRMLVSLFADAAECEHAASDSSITQGAVVARLDKTHVSSPVVPRNADPEYTGSKSAQSEIHSLDSVDDYIEQVTPSRKRSAPSMSSGKKTKKSRKSSVAQPIIATVESVAVLVSNVCVFYV